MKYIWQIKMTNGDVYDVLSTQSKIEDFAKDLLGQVNGGFNVSTFDLAYPTKDNDKVAIINKRVSSIEWK